MTTLKTAAGALALIAAAAAATSACGRVGALQTPASVEAQRQADAKHATSTDSRLPVGPVGGPTGPATKSDAEADRDAPRSTRDIQDPAQKLTPLSTSPIVGAPDPLGGPVSTRPPGI